MPHYETLCILHPELPETRIKEINTWMQTILGGAGGTNGQTDEWGIRELAHAIKKQSRGYYVRLEYDAPAAAVKELERNLKISEDVLRSFSTVCDTASVAQQPTKPPEETGSATVPEEPAAMAEPQESEAPVHQEE